MKKNLVTWLLSSFGALAIAVSAVVLFPGITTYASLAKITVKCANGTTVSCEGSTCGGTDGIGCQCSNGSSAACAPAE